MMITMVLLMMITMVLLLMMMMMMMIMIIILQLLLMRMMMLCFLVIVEFRVRVTNRRDRFWRTSRRAVGPYPYPRGATMTTPLSIPLGP